MGEKQNEPFQLSFNAALKIDFQGSRAGRKWSLAGPKDTARRKISQELHFGDQQLAVCDKLNPIQEPK